MKKKDKGLLVELKQRLLSMNNKEIKQVIAFGSRTSDNADEDSDLDVVILVQEKTPDIEKEIEDIAYQLMWDNDFEPIISLKIFSESQFSNSVKKGYSFYQNVATEGIAI